MKRNAQRSCMSTTRIVDNAKFTIEGCVFGQSATTRGTADSSGEREGFAHPYKQDCHPQRTSAARSRRTSSAGRKSEPLRDQASNVLVAGAVPSAALRAGSSTPDRKMR